MTEEVYLDHIHYRNGKQWVDIDNRLVSSDDPDFSYKNKANRFQTRFNQEDNKSHFVQF